MKKATKIALFSGATIVVVAIAFSLYEFFQEKKEMKEWEAYLKKEDDFEEDFFEDEDF